MIQVDMIWASLPPTTTIQWGEMATIEFRPLRAFWLERILSPEICWDLFQIDSANGPVFKTTTKGLPLEYFGPRSIGPRFCNLRVGPSDPLQITVQAPAKPSAIRLFHTHGQRCYPGGWFVRRWPGRKWPSPPYGMNWQTVPRGRVLVVDPRPPFLRLTFTGRAV